jgi:hypothetical protein
LGEHRIYRGAKGEDGCEGKVQEGDCCGRDIGNSEYDTLTFFGRPLRVLDRCRGSGGLEVEAATEEVRFGTLMWEIEVLRSCLKAGEVFWPAGV